MISKFQSFKKNVVTRFIASIFGRKHSFAPTVLFLLLFIPNASAYTGQAAFSLSAENPNIQEGEQTTVTVQLKTSDLVLTNTEELQTMSSHITFNPADIKIVGEVNFALSPFSVPYVSEIDNSMGSIEWVRARTASDDISGDTITLGTFTIERKTSAETALFFTSGMNAILLNDVYNSDVLGNTQGISFSGSSSDNSDGDTPTTDITDVNVYIPQEDARLSLSTLQTELEVGESTTVLIFLDTGSPENNVSSLDITLSYPTDIFEVTQDALDITSGVLSGVSRNTFRTDGRMELVLFETPSISGENLLIGKFDITRISEGDDVISLLSSSAIYADDVRNSNVLEHTSSMNLMITDSTEISLDFLSVAPTVNASISPASIAENESTTISFQSDQLGNYSVRKNDCTDSSLYASGAVHSVGTEQNISIGGEIFGVLSYQKLVVCVENTSGQTGESNAFYVSVANTPSASTTSSSSGSSAPTAKELEQKGLIYKGESVGSIAAKNKPTVSSTPFSEKEMSINSVSSDSTTKEKIQTDECEAPTSFSGALQSDGKVNFLWDRISDSRVNALTLSWKQKGKSSDAGDMTFPKVSAMNFPAQKLTTGKIYSFSLTTNGDCTNAVSSSVQIGGGDNGAWQTNSNLPSDKGGLRGVASQETQSATPVVSSAGLHAAATSANIMANNESLKNVPQNSSSGTEHVLALLLIAAGMGIIGYGYRRF